MIDELETVRRAFEARAEDPDARERALARLREVMASDSPLRAATEPPRSQARRVRWLEVAAAIIAIVVVAHSVVAPSNHGGTAASTSPVVSAESRLALRKLAGIASSSRRTDIPAGRYLLVSSQDSQISSLESDNVGNEDVATGESFELSVQQTTRTWLAADGSGLRETTVTGVSFPTPQDLQIFDGMKSPPAIPFVGEVKEVKFEAGGLTSELDLSALPTDPSRLFVALQAGVGGTIDDEQVMGRIADLLIYADPPPDLRAALLRVLAGIPGIRFLGSVTDPIGRMGTGVLLPAGPDAKELVFDPSSSAVLATIELSATGNRTPLGWQAYQRLGIVDKIPFRFTT